MEWEGDEKELKAAGAELLTGGRRGLRIHGWEIESRKCSILKSAHRQQYSPFCFRFWFTCSILNFVELNSNSCACLGLCDFIVISWIDWTLFLGEIFCFSHCFNCLEVYFFVFWLNEFWKNTCKSKPICINIPSKYITSDNHMKYRYHWAVESCQILHNIQLQPSSLTSTHRKRISKMHSSSKVMPLTLVNSWQTAPFWKHTAQVFQFLICWVLV